MWEKNGEKGKWSAEKMEDDCERGILIYVSGPSTPGAKGRTYLFDEMRSLNVSLCKNQRWWRRISTLYLCGSKALCAGQVT